MWVKLKQAGQSLCPMKITPDHRCIGSACMAWRWHPRWMEGGSVHEEEGFCGMAGTPLRKIYDDEREDENFTLGVDRPAHQSRPD